MYVTHGNQQLKVAITLLCAKQKTTVCMIGIIASNVLKIIIIKKRKHIYTFCLFNPKRVVQHFAFMFSLAVSVCLYNIYKR